MTARPNLREPAGTGRGRRLVLTLAIALAIGGGTAGISRPGAAAAPSEVGTVVAFTGSDKLTVSTDVGEIMQVQYIGVRGPVRSSLQHAPASAFHGQLVLGRQVRLERDGQEQDGVYQLRHVYVQDGEAPVAAEILAAGWARAVPYPPEHRYVELFHDAQQQAVSQQLNLWQSGVLGPAARWQPPGADSRHALLADPAVHAALDLLLTVPAGQDVLSTLARLGPLVQVRELGQGIGAYSGRIGYEITLNRQVLRAADPRVAATALAHESSHLIDYALVASQQGAFTCFELEQRAFTTQAQIWAEFYGPSGKPAPQDVWDNWVNEIQRFAARGDLSNYVTRSAAYEFQCSGERGAGALLEPRYAPLP